ncbi:hypothetical protein LOC68_05130 [Blastopirellula sp. JC732]|uniref:Uncharacterized protein n=1 Tax=Blastopirellula sediminis TaxID=2894196 RepID=A0A9X1MLM1_9BACT|nr:hypothetical protein [Blastopirellula sediminis]MCC9609454.1 hypothetical protein [Blastopirellula sediminis]MCC9627769.1 hypothetical protein [Blastopirellula sediminis]
MTDEPHISISLDRPSRQYAADDELVARFEISNLPAANITAIEASVLWHTEGTGEEDMSAHEFVRLLPGEDADGDLTRLQSLKTRLPRSPLSYNGKIVKIHWVVRVRVFVGKGRDLVEELEFELTPSGGRNSDMPAENGSGASRG